MTVKQGVIDYRDRLIDMYAIVDNGPSRPSSQSLVQTGKSGQLTTGIAKLAQRAIIELLTDKGSMPYLPNRGTFFMLQIRSGIVRTSSDLFAAFSSAATDVVRQLRLEDTGSVPNDERIESLEMVSANLSGDKATVHATLRSFAGESRDLYIPLSVSPTPVVVEE